ncbi:hypothetical protein Taro_008204 [Colocasia esculenta]|uniref:Glycosyltransferase n=1 Tax=Colocasia esculenta TaxID=4460 RepID=A0A843U2N1_COLES|nr:hypothetical protein [Colocasia esculenta]
MAPPIRSSISKLPDEGNPSRRTASTPLFAPALAAAMVSDRRQLHIFFFPFMAAGHTLPVVDMAKLFARRGVRATILTTPADALSVAASLNRVSEAGHPVEALLVEIPPAEAGVQMDFFMSTARLRDPFERLLREHRPDAVVSDVFFPWSGEVAEELGVPRLIFHGTSFFSLSLSDALFHHPPPESSAGEEGGLYAVPGLPHRIELDRSQIPDFRQHKPEFAEVFVKMKQAEKICFGVVVNSFYELEPEYADHYRNAMGMKAWHVGPVSLCNDDDGDRSARGAGAGAGVVDPDNCLSWLASKEPSSVVYVCFGSVCRFTAAQLREIALGLEASCHPFIWVVRDPAGKGDPSSEQWLPEGFEERTAGTGMVIRGWAPQILLLNHEAVGGFVTHCGWNSCLEGVTAGLPMVAWPMFADQFYNEWLLVQALGVGVSMGGAKRHTLLEEERPLVGAEEVARAVKVLMGGGGEEMRRRARELKEAARAAMREGGSSNDDMGRLIEELLGKQTTPVHAGD